MLAAIKRSVRYRVVAVILATTLVALLVSAAALLTYDVRNYRDFLVADATTMADILARTSAPALQFNDPEAARANLALLETRPGIVSAAIYTANGNVFATFVRDKVELDFQPLASPHGSVFTGDNLQLFHPIVENNELIGTLYLQATYDLLDRLEDYLLILGIVMALSLIVAAVISVRLQRSVTDPVLAVTDLARKVIEERDFTLRAGRTSDDEIGVLVDSFNTMLAEVGQRTAALEETNRRLREETEERRSAETALRIADRRKDEFLATLAHELRNPLAPMVNALSILSDQKLRSDTPRALSILKRQLSHMVRLVDDLLDVSRITRGKLAVHTQRVDLAGIVQSAVDTVQPLMDAHGHTLTVQLPERPIELQADPVRLSQVFSNLLSNAAKYTEPGGTIELRAAMANGRVRIELGDDGIGIDPATLGSIFDMFTQGDTSVERTQSGLGVGLALTRRLIELHGGTIEARSEGLGCGSTFVVELDAIEVEPPLENAAPSACGAAAGASDRAKPRAAATLCARSTERLSVAASLPTPADVSRAAETSIPSPAAAASIPQSTDVPRAAADGAGHRILLVDDNVDFATSLAMLLETLGHEVTVAHDAASGRTAAETLQPEIAFLDLGLPTVSGYDLARQLHDLPATRNTVLVALSGWGQEQDRRQSREAGFVDHLVKPVELRTIETVLETLLTAR